MFKLMSMYSHRQNMVRKKRGPPSKPYFKMITCTHITGRNSAVSVATRYGLDGSEIESRWRRGIPLPSRPALGPTQPPLRWVSGHSQGYNGRGVALTTPPPSHLRPRLKKGKRNTSILGLRGLSYGDLTFLFNSTHVQLFKPSVYCENHREYINKL
jgi:hypothetical protein